MFFDRFSSLFEIYVAANLASIVANNFNKAIEQKVLSGYKASIEWNTRVKSKVNVAKETLESFLLSDKVKIVSAIKLTSVQKKISEINDDFEHIDNTVIKASSTESIKFIPLLSLYGGLYAVAIIIISGFCDKATHSIAFWNGVGLINILSFCYIIIIASRKDKVPTYPWVCFFLFIISLCGLIVFLTMKDDWVIINMSKISLSYAVVISSIFVPILHYLIFIIIGSFNSYFENNKIMGDLKKFEIKFNLFETELNSTVNAVDNLDIFDPSIVEAAKNLTNNKPPKANNTKRNGRKGSENSPKKTK